MIFYIACYIIYLHTIVPCYLCTFLPKYNNDSHFENFDDVSNSNTASNNKKQDNADDPSGPYAAAGSPTTMRNPPTQLMGNLS